MNVPAFTLLQIASCTCPSQMGNESCTTGKAGPLLKTREEPLCDISSPLGWALIVLHDLLQFEENRVQKTEQNSLNTLPRTSCLQPFLLRTLCIASLEFPDSVCREIVDVSNLKLPTDRIILRPIEYAATEIGGATLI
jgi:hypothetical protein